MTATQGVQSRSQGRHVALLGIGLAFLALFLIPLLTQVKGLVLVGGAVVAGFGAALIIYRPHWGVLAVLAAIIIDIDPIGITGLSPPYLLSMVLSLPLTLAILQDREIWVLRLPQIRILFLIGALFLISVAWNYFQSSFSLPPETLRMLVIFVGRLAFLVFFLYFIKTRERIEITVWLIVGLISLLALDALYGFFTKSAVHAHFGEDRSHANFSLAENANRLGYICLFATSLLWFHYSHGKAHRWQALTLPLLFLLPLTTFTTGSRSGLLQTILLVAFILKEQKGWSIRKRIRTFLVLGLAGLFVAAVVPSHDVTRATTFDPSVETAGQASLRNRIATDFAALQIGLSHPLLGVGLGNFRWVKLVTPGLGMSSNTHNAYTWAFTSGGVGVLILYLLLHSLTYRMIRHLESAGPPEFLWLSKGLKVNLFLFLLFSAFTDFWLSDFLYLLVALPISMTVYWQRQYQQARQSLAAANGARIAQHTARRQHQPVPQIFSSSPRTSS